VEPASSTLRSASRPSSAPPTSAPRAAPPASPCTSTDQCVFGTRCANGPGGLQCRNYLDTGGNCANSNECKNLLTCRGAGQATCQAQYALDGGACGNTVGIQCAGATFCATDGGCADIQPSGASCSAAGQCQSYTCSTTCQAACW
jgi:hypothetical protein